MKRSLALFVVIVLVFSQSCGLLNQTGEFNRFVKSNFYLTNVEVIEIGGVDVSKIDNKSELNAGEMLTLAARVFSDKMPTKLKVYIEVENNSKETAAISGLEWKLLMKDVEYANGIVEDRVEVEPNSKMVFPINANVDMLKVLKSESLFQILKVIFNINDEQMLKELGIQLKIKPYYKSGSELKKYPGYISLKP